MRILGGVNGQKFWDVVDDHVIHTALHRAKQMMCQMRDMYRLVNNKVIALSRYRMGVCDHTANRLIVLGAKRRVEP